MTQAEFANRAGITQAYLSNVERGKGEIGAEILLRIALEFDKTIEWLLTGEDRPPTAGLTPSANRAKRRRLVHPQSPWWKKSALICDDL